MIQKYLMIQALDISTRAGEIVQGLRYLPYIQPTLAQFLTLFIVPQSPPRLILDHKTRSKP